MRTLPDLQRPNPEFSVILAAIRLDETQGEHLRELLTRGISWPVVFKLASRHRVLPLLYMALKERAQDIIPPDEMTRLRDAYFSHVQRTLRLEQRLVKTLDLLNSLGIEAIVFKGPVLAIQAYGTSSGRQYTDLDILVHPGDIHATCELLAGAGYHAEASLDPREIDWLLMTSSKDITFKYQNLFIELHWQIFEKFFSLPFDFDQWWRESRLIEVSGKQVRAFSVENTLLMLAVHGTKHYWQQLGWIADIAHLITASPTLDWPSLLAQAEKAGCRRIVALTLHLVETLGGVALNADLQQLYRDDPVAVQLSERIQQHLNAGANPPSAAVERLFYLRARERFRDRCYFIFELLTTPRSAEDRIIAGLPNWLYRVLRPVRLAWKFCVRRVVRKR